MDLFYVYYESTNSLKLYRAKALLTNHVGLSVISLDCRAGNGGECCATLVLAFSQLRMVAQVTNVESKIGLLLESLRFDDVGLWPSIRKHASPAIIQRAIGHGC